MRCLLAVGLLCCVAAQVDVSTDAQSCGDPAGAILRAASYELPTGGGSVFDAASQAISAAATADGASESSGSMSFRGPGAIGVVTTGSGVLMMGQSLDSGHMQSVYMVGAPSSGHSQSSGPLAFAPGQSGVTYLGAASVATAPPSGGASGGGSAGSGSGGSNTAIIAGSVVGGVVAALSLLAAGAFLVARRRRAARAGPDGRAVPHTLPSWAAQRRSKPAPSALAQAYERIRAASPLGGGGGGGGAAAAAAAGSGSAPQPPEGAGMLQKAVGGADASAPELQDEEEEEELSTDDEGELELGGSPAAEEVARAPQPATGSTSEEVAGAGARRRSISGSGHGGGGHGGVEQM